jgi:predicted metal-dependent RNase
VRNCIFSSVKHASKNTGNVISSKEKVEIVRGELTALFTKIQSQARHPHIEGESPKVFSKTVSRIRHLLSPKTTTKRH